MTNNNKGLASIGWNTRLMFHDNDPINVVRDIYDAVNTRGADIINFSWLVEYPNPYVKAEIHNALTQGVICVAAAGNSAPRTVSSIPRIVYPAGYNFGTDGQVIAVGGTMMSSGSEVWVPDWNYSDGTNPISDTLAFVDFAAPGGVLRTLDTLSTSSYLQGQNGTSFSSPIVCGVISLLLAVKNTLTPNQVYDILKNSADKIGTNDYNYVNNTWSPRMGYGRVNAYKALKYTIEHYGGTFDQDVIIPSGDTWNLQPGVTLSFTSGSSLIVNGILNAVGTSSQPITFTSISGTTAGSWGSIVLSGSGAAGSTLSYVNMQYGTNIQATNTSNISVSNCTFSNNNNAITFTGSTGTVSYCNVSAGSTSGIIIQNSSTVTCNYNTVKTSVNGIEYTGGSYGNIGRNDIAYCSSKGISVGSSSAPMFRNVPYAYDRNNRITNCGTGIHISSTNSLPVMYNGSTCNGYNTIYDNTAYDINNLCSSILDAVGVYWKNGNPNNALTNGNVVKSPYCSTDPWAGIPLPKQSATVSSVNDPLLAGIQLRGDDKLKEAKDFYITYLGKNPEDQRANVELYSCYNEETASDITKYFESITDKAKQQNILLSYLYLKQGKINAAKEVNNNIISKTLNNAIATTAKVNNFYIALYYEGDLTAATTILQDIRTKKDTQNADEISLAEYALKTYVPVTNTIKGSSLKGTNDQAVKGIPSALSIDQNYPNPFNPTTNISFSIPQRSNVKLVVYDVLGKEVATLANSIYETGKYNVQFNGSSLASGMYFYTLTTAQGTISKKMLLVK
jgi:hypothetical protein